MCNIACRLDRCFAGRPTIKTGIGTRALAHSIKYLFLFTCFLQIVASAVCMFTGMPCCTGKVCLLTCDVIHCHQPATSMSSVMYGICTAGMPMPVGATYQRTATHQGNPTRKAEVKRNSTSKRPTAIHRGAADCGCQPGRQTSGQRRTRATRQPNQEGRGQAQSSQQVSRAAGLPMRHPRPADDAPEQPDQDAKSHLQAHWQVKKRSTWEILLQQVRMEKTGHHRGAAGCWCGPKHQQRKGAKAASAVS